MEPRWFALWINPEPWAVGDIDIGRNKSGKMFPRVAPNHQLVAFQQAVKEELTNEEAFPEDIKYCLTFYFWRRLDRYVDVSDRKRSAHVADATNLQKGLEDALQGVLFKNDRDVTDIRSILVEQSESTHGRIIIRASESRGLEPHVPRLPESIRATALASAPEERSPAKNGWGDGTELF